MTFCAAGAGFNARGLSAVVEFVWAPFDGWVPLVGAAASGVIAEADDDEFVGLGKSAEREVDDDDNEDEDEDGESAACAAAGLSVFPSAWPLTNVGRITPVPSSSRNVWLPSSVRPGEVWSTQSVTVIG